MNQPPPFLPLAGVSFLALVLASVLIYAWPF